MHILRHHFLVLKQAAIALNPSPLFRMDPSLFRGLGSFKGIVSSSPEGLRLDMEDTHGLFSHSKHLFTLVGISSSAGPSGTTEEPAFCTHDPCGGLRARLSI